MTWRTVCVFCGSAAGSRPEYAAAARDFGLELVRRGLGLVYGGGQVGLMGIVADAVLAAGGEATGVIPHALDRLEVGHKGLTRLHRVHTMHERKARMCALSDAFVALPGGFGTLDELCEVLTWQQLGIHDKPVGLLDVAGYFAGFRAFLDQARHEGFLRAQTRAMLLEDDVPARLLDRMQAYVPPDVPRWLQAGQG